MLDMFRPEPDQVFVDEVADRCRLGRCRGWSTRRGTDGVTMIDLDAARGRYVVQVAAAGPLRARLVTRAAEIALAALVRGVRHPRLVADRDGQVVHVGATGTTVVLEQPQALPFADLGRPPAPVEVAAVLPQVATLHGVECDVEPVHDPLDPANLSAVAASTAGRLGRDARPLVTAALDALDAVDGAGLPHVLAHGDLNGHTVLVGPGGTVTLTGLSCADRRPRVADLAAVAVHLDRGAPLPERARRVADAYPRLLDDAEWAALPAYTSATAAIAFLRTVRENRPVGPALAELAEAVSGLVRCPG